MYFDGNASLSNSALLNYCCYPGHKRVRILGKTSSCSFQITEVLSSAIYMSSTTRNCFKPGLVISKVRANAQCMWT